MTRHPSPDASLARLHAAGWSVGEVVYGSTWFVSGANGENVLRAEGTTQSEAWHQACLQGAAFGMLASRSRTCSAGRRWG
jgi:hypothetical protein